MHDLTFREALAPIVRDLVAELRSAPLVISQINSEMMMGISARTHLETCRRPDFAPRVTKLGKLRLVDAAEYRAWLSAMDSSSRNETSATTDAVDPADQILREFGFRRMTATGD